MQYASVARFGWKLDHMNKLEAAWRWAHEAYVTASADIERVRDCCDANAGLIDVARARLKRAEALKARILAEMERPEEKSGEPADLQNAAGLYVL
jgi:hypothetical protein